jgi:transposase
VASDVRGLSGRAKREAIGAGTSAPAVLANRAHDRRRAEHAALEQAWSGRVRSPQRVLWAETLGHSAALEESLPRVSAASAQRVRSLAAASALLATSPGVGRQGAEALRAASGPDRSRFPSAPHLAASAGSWPGTQESAGQRTSGKTRKGSPWWRSLLVAAAWGAAQTKDLYRSAP